MGMAEGVPVRYTKYRLRPIPAVSLNNTVGEPTGQRVFRSTQSQPPPLPGLRSPVKRIRRVLVTAHRSHRLLLRLRQLLHLLRRENPASPQVLSLVSLWLVQSLHWGSSPFCSGSFDENVTPAMRLMRRIYSVVGEEPMSSPSLSHTDRLVIRQPFRLWDTVRKVLTMGTARISSST